MRSWLPDGSMRSGLLTLGLNVKDIASIVGISEWAARMAFGRIYRKTGTSDKLELAVRYAWEEFTEN